MVDWPKEDVINWVEWRVRSFEVSRENVRRGFGSEEPDHPLSELDLRIWLANRRDDKSLTAIARKQYPREWRKDKGKRNNQTTISRIRRSIGRVDKFLNLGKRGFAYPKKWREQLDNGLKNALFRT